MASQIFHNNPQTQYDRQASRVTPARVRPEDKKTRAKKALWSLTIAIVIPLSLTLFIIFKFGSGKRYRAIMNKPFWFPPLWLIHLASIGSSFSMSLAAWLIWVDRGFHLNFNALPLYISQISLSIVWDPLELVMGAVWLGFIFCLLHLGILFACYLSFRKVNPFARDLVKPCLVWFTFLTIVSYKLIAL
ncbi:translocator protein homolog [Durio zibethinus]|uniref:Translocator protein homolog n=1 Tax=Durio zibethinus TaxID=66656 RepID=A0A6P5Z8J3_DURZI|nr:translocator protein homolog [Durio zibethinus]